MNAPGVDYLQSPQRGSPACKEGALDVGGAVELGESNVDGQTNSVGSGKPHHSSILPLPTTSGQSVAWKRRAAISCSSWPLLPCSGPAGEAPCCSADCCGINLESKDGSCRRHAAAPARRRLIHLRHRPPTPPETRTLHVDCMRCHTLPASQWQRARLPRVHRPESGPVSHWVFGATSAQRRDANLCPPNCTFGDRHSACGNLEIMQLA